jgi:hypothetical protein
MLFDALGVGATAGLLAEVLVLRTNPEVTQSLRGVLVGLPLWASWGMLCLGIPLLAALALLQRIRPKEDRWLAPALCASIFVVTGILSRANAHLHAHSLEETIRRILVQDGVVWVGAAILALGGGSVVRRFGASRRLRLVFLLAVLALPIVRVLWATTPPRFPLEAGAQRLGEPKRPLLVIGVEGLDTKVLMADTAIGSFPSIERLRQESSWGPLVPHSPHIRWALWTSVATGTFPGRHGVKAQWGWDLPLVFPETLRLLPWTPEGSRMILPWGLAKRIPPPPATIAPLWERLMVSDMTTEVFGWPGAWADDSIRRMDPEEGRSAGLEASMAASLEAALEPFPNRRAEIWGAIVRDQKRVDAAVIALGAGTENVWIHLETLSLARRYHEPLRPRHTRERSFIELVFELLDEQIGALLSAVRRDALVAVVSPYGLAPPNSVERLRRLLGGGGSWRTSAETGPNGLLILLGDDVPVGRRLPTHNLPDVAPTLCYLLGLPVAQSMEGGVIVDAVEPEFLAENPLRVVD